MRVGPAGSSRASTRGAQAPGIRRRDRSEQYCRFPLHIEEIPARGVESKSELENAELFRELGCVRFVLPRLQVSPIEGSPPMFALRADGNHQLSLGRGRWAGQSKHPREHASQEGAPVLDTKTPGRPND